MNYLDAKRVELIYEMPLAEVLLNSTTASIRQPRYASLTMSSGTGERSGSADILGTASRLMHAQPARLPRQQPKRGRMVCERLRKEIPASNLKLPSRRQSVVLSSARETIVFRKDVIWQVLWLAIFSQAQAAGKTEGRQEADEDGRKR